MMKPMLGGMTTPKVHPAATATLSEDPQLRMYQARLGEGAEGLGRDPVVHVSRNIEII